MGLIDDLAPGPIGLDTAVFIYFIEAAPNWLELVRPLFVAADTGQRSLVTSALTLLEVLVVPYRANDHALAARYERLLTGARGITLVEVTAGQLRQAAQLRARTGVRTPDALQLAAAQSGGCTTFITNDRRLPSLDTLKVVQLADYLR